MRSSAKKVSSLNQSLHQQKRIVRSLFDSPIPSKLPLKGVPYLGELTIKTDPQSIYVPLMNTEYSHKTFKQSQGFSSSTKKRSPEKTCKCKKEAVLKKQSQEKKKGCRCGIDKEKKTAQTTENIATTLNSLKQELSQMKQAIDLKSGMVELLEQIIQMSVTPNCNTQEIQVNESIASSEHSVSLPKRIPYERYRRENAVSNLKYKTSLCKHFQVKGDCPLKDDCQFAHGMSQLRPITSHPLYKTRACRLFIVGAKCPYGDRCYYFHTDEERQAALMSRELEAIFANVLDGTDQLVMPPSEGNSYSAIHNLMNIDLDLLPKQTSNITTAQLYPPLTLSESSQDVAKSIQQNETKTPLVDMDFEQVWKDFKTVDFDKRYPFQVDSANASMNDSNSGRTAGSMPSTCASLGTECGIQLEIPSK